MFLRSLKRSFPPLPFAWTHKPNARRKRIAVYVTPEGVVELRTPLRCSETVMYRFLDAHQDWVMHQLKRVQGQRADYQLFGVEYAEHEATKLMAEQGFSDWESFARTELDHYIRSRLRHWWPQVAHFNRAFPKASIRKMKTKWGSCSENGAMRFSLALASKPQELIDYVVVHELCHLKEMNHSPAFWHEVESLMPDWRLRRDALRG